VNHLFISEEQTDLPISCTTQTNVKKSFNEKNVPLSKEYNNTIRSKLYGPLREPLLVIVVR